MVGWFNSHVCQIILVFLIKLHRLGCFTHTTLCVYTYIMYECKYAVYIICNYILLCIHVSVYYIFIQCPHCFFGVSFETGHLKGAPVAHRWNGLHLGVLGDQILSPWSATTTGAPMAPQWAQNVFRNYKDRPCLYPYTYT